MLAVVALLTLASRDEEGAGDSLKADFEEAGLPERQSGGAPTSATVRASAAEPSPEDAYDAESPPVVEEPAPVALDRRSATPPPTSAFANNPVVANAPPSNSPQTPTELPNRRSDDPLAAAPAADILDSLQIYCDFAAGNNTGLRFGDVLTVGGGAQWRGGPIVYDNVDLVAGTARMTGSVGATGSPIGEAKVRFTTEGTRVYLTGFLENRTYVVVTIFDELDNVGRHIAVMSRIHGGGEYAAAMSFAAQFLGTCESL